MKIVKNGGGKFWKVDIDIGVLIGMNFPLMKRLLNLIVAIASHVDVERVLRKDSSGE